MLGTLLGTKKKKHAEKQPQYVEDNSFESLGKGLVDSLKNDLVKPMLPSAKDQFLGLEDQKKEHGDSGELYEGVEFDIRSLEEKRKDKNMPMIEAAIDYRREILHGSERLSKQESYELKAQIEQIQMEIQQLLHSTKELEAVSKDVVVQHVPVRVGKYHKTFGAFVLAALHAARLKVEDSLACMSMVKGKGRKKQDYWGMFKQHGTTFGMSNERMVATQTG